MSKVIKSPLQRWAGEVTISDPLTLSQAHLIEDGLTQPQGGEDGRIWFTVIDDKQLPAILGCVEKWSLSNFPENPTLENFPASPRGDSHKLIDWLFSEIRNVYFGEAQVPNESSPTLTDTQAKDITAEK